jgi:hypothetical protein
MGHKFKTKRVGSMQRKNPKARLTWTPDELDAMLNYILGCNKKSSYWLCCTRAAGILNRGEILGQGKWTAHSVDSAIWKMASRYEAGPFGMDYVPGPRRQDRQGLPLTFMETRFIRWGFGRGLDAQKRLVPPTNEHMAAILMRSVEEIKTYRRRCAVRNPRFEFCK